MLKKNSDKMTMISCRTILFALIGINFGSAAREVKRTPSSSTDKVSWTWDPNGKVIKSIDNQFIHVDINKFKCILNLRLSIFYQHIKLLGSGVTTCSELNKCGPASWSKVNRHKIKFQNPCYCFYSYYHFNFLSFNRLLR